MSRRAYECKGCGRLSYKPDEDLVAIRERGKLACCPEREIKPVWVSDEAPTMGWAEVAGQTVVLLALIFVAYMVWAR